MPTTTRSRWDPDEAANAVFAGLVERGLVAPVALGDEDEGAWIDCELATFAEHRLGEVVDPVALDEATRARWRGSVLTERLVLPSRREDIERCAWLLSSEGERAGTVAVATSTLGGRLLRVSSLYVRPTHRGRSIGSNALRAVRDVLHPLGLGLKLSTSWTWPRTVRFYVGLGLWLRMWKDDLEFVWDAASPSPILEIVGDRAVMSVVVDGKRHDVAEARREGNRLLTFETSRDRHGPLSELVWNASSTFALRLALAGWPLIRSPEALEEARGSDAGPPEALAEKIAIWEAWDRKHGWRVDTPQVPGLAYPTWEELEARWEARARSYEERTRGGC